MKEVFIIRHGSTQVNLEGRVLGNLDADLTEEGYKEVGLLAVHLQERGIRPQTIYASPYRRIIQTAEILQIGLGGIILKNPLLREVDYGDYEGGSREILREIEYGYNAKKMKKGKAESVDEVEKRILTFVEALLKTSDSCIFVVTHAFTASVATQLLMGVPRIFQTVQPLATADYSYFRVGEGGENMFNVLDIQTNRLKGRLNI